MNFPPQRGMYNPGPASTILMTWPWLERPGYVGFGSYGRYQKPYGGLYSDAINYPSFTFMNPFQTSQGIPQSTMAFHASRMQDMGMDCPGWGALGRGVFGRRGGVPRPLAGLAAPYQ